MGTCLDHAEGLGEHGNFACGNSNAVGIGLISHINHMGLATDIKMS